MGLGAVAGMRSLSAPALLSRRLAQDGGRRARDLPERLLSSRVGARALTVLAAGEMLADKSPWIPSRTDPLPLAGRALMGALTGAALAGRQRRSGLAPALLGATAAVAAAVAAYHLRRLAGQRSGIPDPVLGLMEDALALGLGTSLVDTVR